MEGEGRGAQALQRAGLLGPHSATRVLTLTPRTLSDVMDSILEVGAAAGVGPEAHCLVDRLRTRLRAVACQVAGAKRRPRVLSLESVNPLVLGVPRPPVSAHVACPGLAILCDFL